MLKSSSCLSALNSLHFVCRPLRATSALVTGCPRSIPCSHAPAVLQVAARVLLAVARVAAPLRRFIEAGHVEYRAVGPGVCVVVVRDNQGCGVVRNARGEGFTRHAVLAADAVLVCGVRRRKRQRGLDRRRARPIRRDRRRKAKKYDLARLFVSGTTVPSAVIVPVPPEGDANTGSPANRLANTQRLVAGRLRGHCPRTGTANRAEDREVSDGFRDFIEGQLGQGQRPRLISLTYIEGSTIELAVTPPSAIPARSRKLKAT